MTRAHYSVAFEYSQLLNGDGLWERTVWIGTDSEENETIQP